MSKDCNFCGEEESHADWCIVRKGDFGDTEDKLRRKALKEITRISQEIKLSK